MSRLQAQDVEIAQRFFNDLIENATSGLYVLEIPDDLEMLETVKNILDQSGLEIFGKLYRSQGDNIAVRFNGPQGSASERSFFIESLRDAFKKAGVDDVKIQPVGNESRLLDENCEDFNWEPPV